MAGDETALVVERFVRAVAAGNQDEVDRLVLPDGVFARLNEAFGLAVFRKLIGPPPPRGRELLAGVPLTAVLRRHGRGLKIDEVHAVSPGAQIRAEDLGPARVDLYLGRTLLPLRRREPAAAGFLQSVYRELRHRGFPLFETATALAEALEVWQGFREQGVELRSCLRVTPINKVFAARLEASGKRVVLKMANTADAEVRTNFHRETEILAELKDHPAVPPLLGRGEWKGIPYQLSARARGTLLADLLRRGGATLRTGLAVAELLRDLHGRGIVHRDVAPDHLFVDSRGRVRIIDFGMARRGGEARMDVFCLGLVLCELLAGAPLFRYRHPSLAEEVPAALERLRDLPPGLRGIVLRALAAAPEKYLPVRLPAAPYEGMGPLVRDLTRAL